VWVSQVRERFTPNGGWIALPMPERFERFLMKTQLIRNFGAALLAVASVYAQGSQTLNVRVPFGFHVGNSMLPPGEYMVDNAAPGVLRLRSADSKSSAMIITMAIQTFDPPSQGKLVFNKYGDAYFLSQVWKAGSNSGSELRKTRRETEVAANARRGIESIIAKQ
jgi:hypothetical protein